jgi:hypothetical protein
MQSIQEALPSQQLGIVNVFMSVRHGNVLHY